MADIQPLLVAQSLAQSLDGAVMMKQMIRNEHRILSAQS
jgi:hypothetical protein